MTYETSFAQCVISLTMLMLMWFAGFRPMQRDTFRCRIRRIRDRLFDYAVDHDCLENEAYINTRLMLNGILRMSGRMSPASLTFGILLYLKNQDLVETADTSESLPSGEFRDVIQRACIAAGHELLRFVFLTGPIGIFFRVFGKVWNLNQWMLKQADRIKSEAFLIGREEYVQGMQTI